MTLALHSDAGYLNEPEEQNRSGRHFFMSTNTILIPNNGVILTIAQIIKNYISSSSESEIGSLYIAAREAAYIRIILNKLGHKQPKTSNTNQQLNIQRSHQQKNPNQNNQSHVHAILLVT